MTISEHIKLNINGSFREEDLPFTTQFQTVQKGHVFCDYQETGRNIYFLQSGIVQVNIENSRSDIRIVDFFFKDSFFGSYSSILESKPSDVQIVAATDCKVEVIFAEELFKAYETSLIANQLGRVETEKLYLKKVKREKEFLTLSAEERYINLISDNSEMISQLSIDSIAKYLGIHPESLSRIRSKTVQQIKKGKLT